MTASFQRDNIDNQVAELGNRVAILERKARQVQFSGQGTGVGTLPASSGSFLGILQGEFTNDTTFFNRTPSQPGFSDPNLLAITVPIGGVYLFYYGMNQSFFNLVIEGTCEARDAATNTWTFVQPLQVGQWFSTTTVNYYNHGYGIWVCNLATGQDAFRFNVYGSNRTASDRFVSGGGSLLLRFASLPALYSNLGAETGTWA